MYVRRRQKRRSSWLDLIHPRTSLLTHAHPVSIPASRIARKLATVNLDYPQNWSKLSLLNQSSSHAYAYLGQGRVPAMSQHDHASGTCKSLRSKYWAIQGIGVRQKSERALLVTWKHRKVTLGTEVCEGLRERRVICCWQRDEAIRSLNKLIAYSLRALFIK